MDPTLKNDIAELLAQARDITQDALGTAPPVVVAEVFRQLCISLDAGADEWSQEAAPHAVH